MTDKKQHRGPRAQTTGDEAGGTAKAPRKVRASAPDGSGAKAAGSPCPIVGVGASAGGLEAFTRLLKALPARIGMALVLVQHLDPTQDSMLADILGRVSKMPVSEATDGMRVESDRVYVIPPDVSIRISGGAFILEKRPKPPTQVLPIDVLLRSLAEECENKAVGVVLSGTGSDGSLGLAAVKAAGGLTIAQEPSTAEYGGMPKAAIDAGAADAVLDPEHIAEELVRLGRHPGLRESKPPDETAEAVDEVSFAKILALVRAATGLDLRSYRRTTLVRRISRRMLLEGVTTMKDYLDALQERPSEVEALYRDILVNVTEFFRDPDALDALKREVFPEVLKHKGSGESIRIWVPGCAKGQEAYSILITLVELLEGESSHPEIQMFASDVNELDVDFARVGVYPHGIVNEVSAERLARFFVQVPGGYQIDRGIREKCVFAVHDITKDPPFSRLDIVSFRNVMIYMERPLQQRVLQIIHYALEPGGFLLLGASETTGTESAFFSVVDKKHRIYRRKTGPGKLLSALAPSAGALGFAQRGTVGQQEPVFDILGEAERVVRGRYSPAGILVTADLDVLHFRGHVGRYLDPAEGPPEFKLPRLIDPTLSLTVEAAIREAAKANAASKRRGTAVEPDGEGREIDVEAVPIASPTGDAYYLVLFEERPKQTPESRSPTKPGEERDVEEGETPLLRRQLGETREQLEAVVSERDAANAELRVAGEKYQSSNEELRTINEEFQTAQEELQSTNEELTTLNDELRNRNTELGRLADDLNNVIEGVEIPILILDADLRIRRFTPQTEAIVSIVPTDIGRPITDLSMKVDVPDFQDRVREVLRNGVPHETEVRNGDGRWFSVRIRPYKTGEGTVEGVVIAFIDIDELKKSTGVAEAAREHAEAVVDTVREPLLTLTADLHVREANDAFYRAFAVTAEETIGGLVYELGDGQWDFPQLRSLFEQVIPGDREFTNLEVERSFPRVGNRIMMLSARRVREEHGRPSILFVIDDVTQLRQRERLSASLNSISVTIGSTLELDRVLEQILKESTEALGAESSAVLFKQDTSQVVRKVYGMSPEILGDVFEERELAAGITSLGLSEPALLDPAEAARFVSFSKLDIELDDGSVLVVPLLLREEPIGWILFHYRSSSLTLGDSETDFARRLGTLMSFTFENARLYATQREIAETLQSALLTVPPRIPGIDFGYLYRSATTSAAVGGDFYDLFELEENRVGIVLGDVSGKGVQAAKLTALVKNTVRALAYEDESPATVLGKTSAVILKVTPAEIFVTIMFGVLDTTSGRLAYCSAGHTTGIVKRSGGGAELLEVGSPIAGAFAGIEFRDGKTVIEEDDLLVLYTDGVTEARQDGELFGQDRLVDFVRNMEPLRPKEVPQTIFDEILRFTGGKLSDDVAIVSVTRARKG
ncbi:MAG: SpoIIE family protein phosphatase [Coriobacteriia bacterium]|nr:SpoIIE family protein phosphatase [Coriobacteriia bacterium]